MLVTVRWKLCSTKGGTLSFIQTSILLIGIDGTFMQQKRFDLLKVGKTSKTVKIIPPVILLSMERKLNLVSLNKDEFTKYGPAVKT